MADFEEDLVPTVFKWDHGGEKVYITGTFNDWELQIPMTRIGYSFTYTHALKHGKYAYKFIVDDEWRYAHDQQTVADVEGKVSNFIEISGSTSYLSNPDMRGGLEEFYAKYTLEIELGSGTFSKVIQATRNTTNDKVAVKIVDMTKMNKDELNAEISILSALHHPNIIRLHEVFKNEATNETYLVTELVSGGELFDRIVSLDHYSEIHGRHLIKTLLSTLRYVHQRGFVHRDLKPENIL
jgi:serine/threonine protein kinase